MKQVCTLLLIAAVFFISCDSEQEQQELLDEIEAEIITPVDPTIIKEYHEINATGDIRRIFYFDTNGHLTKDRVLTENFETHYIQDTQHRIIEISTKTLSGVTIEVMYQFTYDTDDHITQINNRTFFYKPSENTYYEDNYAMQDGVLLDTNNDVSFNKYYFNQNNPILQYCSAYTTVEQNPYYFIEDCYEDISWIPTTTNGNVRSFDNNVVLEYNNIVNPLFAHTNLNEVIAFIPSLRNQYTNVLFLSQNTPIKKGESFGPEQTEYTYDINQYNLPTTTYTTFFYVGNQEGPTRISGKYYYQE